jgi:hypothetical protein
MAAIDERRGKAAPFCRNLKAVYDKYFAVSAIKA